MKRKDGNSQELATLNPEELDKFAGGKILKITYYRNKDNKDTRLGREQKKEVYYCPRNGKYYLSSLIATETDKELGGTGEIIDGKGFDNVGIPNLDDAPNVSKAMFPMLYKNR